MSETYQGLITITDLTDNKACEIRGVNVFKYNENGEIPSASSSITLTATLSDNISGSNWQYKNSLGNFVDFSPITTGDTITINHTDGIFINDIATIKKLTSDESVFDIFTITKIRDGSPGDALINASLSNDNQTIPCDANGIPFESSFPISSKITIYEGAEDITSKYSISVTIQSDSGVPRLIGSISGDTFTATSWNALSQSYYTATVTFTCTRTGYPPINKVLTLSKVATGSSPNYYELTYDILATNKNISNIFNPSSVTFRANHINGELTEDYQGYLKLYRVKLDGTQETITTSNMSSDGASGYKYTYTFSQTLDANTKYLLAELYKTDSVGDYLDKQSIIVTSDGQSGSSPINIVLGNVADVIPCDVNGKLKTDLIINIPFTAYKGTSQISATITKSNITTRPSNLTDDNITITSSTSSSSGNIQFTLYAGSELGNDSGEITLTFTCNGKQVPMKYGWSKSIQAPPGADGKTYYMWIKYADSPTSGMSDNPSGKAYIGIAHNKASATESTTYSDYTWSLIKGETGADGNGITTITQYYAKTTTFSKPSAESITSTTMPELDNTYRYLWMKEVIAFTKSGNQTVITLIAARGDNGEMSPEQVAQLNKASQDASDAVSKVDNLEIGGRNLLKQYIRAGGQCVKIDDLTVKVGTNVADTYFYLKSHCALTAGETYTISCEASNVPDGCNWSFGVRAQASAWQLYINKNGKNFATGVLDANVDADTDFILDDLYGRPSTAPNIILTNFKLEKGNKATDWTPAPEDVDAGIKNAANVAKNYIHADDINGLVVNNNQTVGVGYDVQLKADGSNTGMNIRQDGEILASFLQNHVSLGKNSINSKVAMCGDKGGVSASFGYYVDSVTSMNGEQPGSTLSFDFNETTFKNKVGQTTGFYEFVYTSAGGWELFEPVRSEVTLSQYGITMKTPTSSLNDFAQITIKYVLDGSVKFYNADTSNPVRKLELEMAENPSSSESDYANITIERQSGTYASGDGKEHSIITMMTLHEFANVATLQLFDDSISLDATHVHLTSTHGEGSIQLNGDTNIDGNTKIWGQFQVVNLAGEIKMWAGNEIPYGWLLCDGSEVSKTDYPELYGAIGDLWGTPSSSSNFKLPNLTGRVPVGYNSADTDTTETFGKVGATGGARGAWYHTHTIGSSGAHNHASVGRVEGSGTGANIFESFNGASKTRSVNVPRSGTNGNHTHSPGSSGSSGNKLAADKANMPPYAVVKYIICAF